MASSDHARRTTRCDASSRGFLKRPALALIPLVILATGACGRVWPLDPAARHPIVPFTVPAAREGVTYLRFLAFGDHGTGTRGQQQVADALALRAARDGTDFMILLGDNFYEGGVRSVDDPQWITKWEQVYAAPALQVPVYPTLGNHDYRGNVQAQLDYAKRSARWRMPARYYTFRRPLDAGQHAQFFAIDSEMLGREDPEQGRWLERELADSTASWKIVFGHHPLYSRSGHGDHARMIGLLGALFERHGVDLYLSGHHHLLELLEPVRGVTYAVCGAGGGPTASDRANWTEDTLYTATRGGFCLLRLSLRELVIEFVRMQGETQYAYVLRKETSSDLPRLRPPIYDWAWSVLPGPRTGHGTRIPVGGKSR
jgi:acid phosphatase